MFDIDTKTLLIILVIHAVVPISWVSHAPFIPRAVQTMAIVLVTSSAFLFCSGFRLRWGLVLTILAYIVTTFLTNLLLANLFNCRMM